MVKPVRFAPEEWDKIQARARVPVRARFPALWHGSTAATCQRVAANSVFPPWSGDEEPRNAEKRVSTQHPDSSGRIKPVARVRVIIGVVPSRWAKGTSYQ